MCGMWIERLLLVEDDSSKVSAGTYVSALCLAISPLEADVRTRTAALEEDDRDNASRPRRTSAASWT